MKKFLTLTTLSSILLTACNSGSSGSSGSSVAYLPQGYYTVILSDVVSNPASLDCTVSTSSNTGDVLFSNGNGQLTNVSESFSTTLNLNNNPCQQSSYTIESGTGTAMDELKNCQYNSATGTMTADEIVTLEYNNVSQGTCTATVTLTAESSSISG